MKRFDMYDSSGKLIGDYAGHEREKAIADMEAYVAEDPEMVEHIAIIPYDDDGNSEPAIFPAGRRGDLYGRLPEDQPVKA
ncbi:MAG TPA: hypothetical protein VN238_17195 [Solirubrobacteraceae bacterium]|nr:hypothetical protein [Solirubrobacteraceae bacterium]